MDGSDGVGWVDVFFWEKDVIGGVGWEKAVVFGN